MSDPERERTGTWFTLAKHRCGLCGHEHIGLWIDDNRPTGELQAESECSVCGRLAEPVPCTIADLRERLVTATYTATPPGDEE